MVRTLAFAAAVALGAGASDAGCLVFCPKNGELTPAAAAQTLARDLGKDLPPGVTVLGMIDGGFQDRFVQVKLGADMQGTLSLLAALSADVKKPLQLGEVQTTVDEADWWDIDTRPDLVLVKASLGRFPYVIVGWAADPADTSRWLIYVLAFET